MDPFDKTLASILLICNGEFNTTKFEENPLTLLTIYKPFEFGVPLN